MHTSNLRYVRNLLMKFLIGMVISLLAYYNGTYLWGFLIPFGKTVVTLSQLIYAHIFISDVRIIDLTAIATAISIISLRFFGLKWSLLFVAAVFWIYLILQYLGTI